MKEWNTSLKNSLKLLAICIQVSNIDMISMITNRLGKIENDLLRLGITAESEILSRRKVAIKVLKVDK